MKRSTISCFIRVITCFICITFLFASCGKDKTIEKIIYGEPGNSENKSKILNIGDFNSFSISQEFNSINDFYNYINQCCVNKTNLLGIKFKIKDSFALNNTLEYFEDYYFYKQIFLYSNVSSGTIYFTVSFVNTDLNSNVSNIGELVFIVNVCRYVDGSIEIRGYSYL